MNLYFRLIWIVISSFFKARIDFDDKISINVRVLPNDLDINRHLNNGRYLTILDLCSVEFFSRTGVLKKCYQKGLRPIIGGVVVTYRKGLSLFERCTITMHLEAWDERWNYFRFEYRKSNGQLAAGGFIKGAFLSKQGIVPNQQADEIFGYQRASCEIPPAIENWIASEMSIISN